LDANYRRWENGCKPKSKVKAKPMQAKGKGGANENHNEDVNEKKNEKGNAFSTQARTKTPSFKKPSLEEVQTYCQMRKNSVDPQKFYDYFEASGWVDSKGAKVKNWKQKIITWEQNEKVQTQESEASPYVYAN
jgi:hypothetical protein